MKLSQIHPEKRKLPVILNKPETAVIFIFMVPLIFFCLWGIQVYFTFSLTIHVFKFRLKYTGLQVKHPEDCTYLTLKSAGCISSEPPQVLGVQTFTIQVREHSEGETRGEVSDLDLKAFMRGGVSLRCLEQWYIQVIIRTKTELSWAGFSH